MSEEEREIDVELDEDDSGLDTSNMPENKRALHNAMERKRRDSIKDSFRGLQECIPNLRGDKTSRAQVLKKTGDYISTMQQKIAKHQEEIQDLKNQNLQLEAQIRQLEKAKSMGPLPPGLLGATAGIMPPSDLELEAQELVYEDSSSDTSDSAHSFNQINLLSNGVVKSISGVTLAPALGAAAPAISPATITIAPGQSLLTNSIRVQPGQSLLLAEPMRKKKKIQ